MTGFIDPEESSRQHPFLSFGYIQKQYTGTLKTFCKITKKKKNFNVTKILINNSASMLQQSAFKMCVKKKARFFFFNLHKFV